MLLPGPVAPINKIMSPKRLDGKVCIITGSSSGIGRAIALTYAQQGASIICADLRATARGDVSAERAINTDELIRQGGGHAKFVQTDVSKDEAVDNMVRQAVAAFGRVDV